MEIKVGKVSGNRLLFTIVDGKDVYTDQIFMGDIKRPLSEFCNIKELLPLMLLFYAKILGTGTSMEDLRNKLIKVEAVK